MVVSPPLRRNRNFRRLLIGQSLSDLGSNVSTLAYPLLVLALTHSPFIAGAVGSTQLAVAMAFRLPAGAIADRVDRRRLMIACDAVRLAALGGLGLTVLLQMASWELVIVVAVADSSLAVFFSPAEAGTVRAVVPDPGQMPQAMAANEVRNYGAAVAGPPLGGALFSLAQGAPFVADAASYAISIGTLLGMRGNFRPQGRPEQRLHQDIAAGIAFVLGQPFLRALVVLTPLINFAANGAIFSVVLALRQNGVHPALIGSAEAMITAGGLLGAVSAAWLVRRMSLWKLSMLICWVGAVLLLVSAREAGSLLMAMPIAGTIFLGPAANAALIARQMAITPHQMQGRVQSTLLFASQGLAASAPVLAGLIIAKLSATVVMLVFSATLVLAGVVCTFSDRIRHESKAAAVPLQRH